MKSYRVFSVIYGDCNQLDWLDMSMVLLSLVKSRSEDECFYARDPAEVTPILKSYILLGK